MNKNFYGSKHLPLFALSPLLAAAVLSFAFAADAADIGRTFASPEDAVRALSSAVNSHDSNALAAIFGPDFDKIESADPVQEDNEVAIFAKRMNESTHLERTGDGERTLEIGNDGWPFAIPIVQNGGVWYFDTKAGADELLSRRVGRNELEALDSVRAYVDAQRDYASQDRNGDDVLQFAQKILSSPGAKDGLYWSPDIDGEISPLGPLFADAQSKGYFKNLEAADAPQPFNGYLFKILTRQGKHAPGGKYNYIVNGRMISGFALVAWPAQYGNSGVMTFIVNQRGVVYQRDLGPKTSKLAADMTTYDPGPGWVRSPD